jgi:hypothetical protein
MPRDHPSNRQMRSRIAHLAARLMAQDGIDDFALAKRKAAKQVGAPDTRNLPDNAEIEDALKAYQQLYQPEEQATRLTELREAALDMMRALDVFHPHLVGPVLSGSAGRYAEIDLHLFADSAKDVELFLINRGIAFRTREERFWAGDELRQAPSYGFETPQGHFNLTVFLDRDLRQPLRTKPEGRPIERVRSPWLEARLAAPAGTTPD